MSSIDASSIQIQSMYKKKNSKLYSEYPTYMQDPELYQSRIKRIKHKIDDLIKYHTVVKDNTASMARQDTKDETFEINSSVITGREMSFPEDDSYASTRRNRNMTFSSINYFLTEASMELKDVKMVIKSIYNELNQLQNSCSRTNFRHYDANIREVIEEDEEYNNRLTISLRGFEKELKNQRKRLVKMVPENYLRILQHDKTKPYNKSIIQLEPARPEKYNEVIKEEMSSSKNSSETTTIHKRKLGSGQSTNSNKQTELDRVQMEIDKQFSKSRVIKEEEDYCSDQEQRCRMCKKCQLI